MTESNLTKLILLEASKLGARLFRNNVGLGWIGKLIRIKERKSITVYPGDVILKNARPFHAGLCKGSSDLIGWFNGRFLAVEVKTKTGKLSLEQKNFIKQVNNNGGIGVVARNIEDFTKGVK